MIGIEGIITSIKNFFETNLRNPAPLISGIILICGLARRPGLSCILSTGNILQEISKSTGESMTNLYDRISKGKISVDEITASMERSTSVGGKYFQSMEKQSKTVNGQISTLKDNAIGSL